MKTLANTRNIGISAHIDSGKTTLTERVLFYTDKIHKIEEVRGGGAGAKMDHMELEKEKGITITSAATTAYWNGSLKNGITFAEGNGDEIKLNIIDTPGHVDFTVEVERSLRVLDGAVLILCAVAGVQSQSITVDKQMRRYKVPRLAFLNKMDRLGANAYRATDSLRDKLGHNTVLMQIPIGAEDDFEGIVDLITKKAWYFDGANGENVRIEECPAEYEDKMNEYREKMLDVISEFDDDLTEAILMDGEVTEAMIHKAVKSGVKTLHLTPVFCGSAFKNKAIQPLLDAVARYLPSPVSAEPAKGINLVDGSDVFFAPDKDKDLICMAFKITDEKFGQLTYTRIYQGTLRKGDTIYNTRTKRKLRVGRLVRMNSNDRENIDSASAGDIIAMVGVDCASGDTFVGNDELMVTCEGIHVPIPVIELSIRAKDRNDEAKLSKGISRFLKEDPTFHVKSDAESGETLISGMGELHLEIYVERLRREYGVDVQVGQPQVNYRETIKAEVGFDYTHKKQTGGSGQFGQVVGMIRPLVRVEGDPEDLLFKFHNEIKGGVIPTEFIPSCEKGFQDVMDKGPLAAFPLIDVEVFLRDGKYHDVDSSDMAFRIAARQAMRQAIGKANPTLKEPVMTVEVETPEEYQGFVIGDLSGRRGIIQGTTANEHGETVVNAFVPLAEMFGYSTVLRSGTAGKATFSMELAHYAECPRDVQEKVVKARAEKLAND